MGYPGSVCYLVKITDLENIHFYYDSKRERERKKKELPILEQTVQ